MDLLLVSFPSLIYLFNIHSFTSQWNYFFLLSSVLFSLLYSLLFSLSPLHSLHNLPWHDMTCLHLCQTNSRLTNLFHSHKRVTVLLTSAFQTCSNRGTGRQRKDSFLLFLSSSSVSFSWCLYFLLPIPSNTSFLLVAQLFSLFFLFLLPLFLSSFFLFFWLVLFRLLLISLLFSHKSSYSILNHNVILLDGDQDQASRRKHLSSASIPGTN